MHLISKNLLLIAALGLGGAALVSNLKGKTNYPVEAGPAAFLRSETEALKKATQSGKPVFAFFQEVPG